MATNFSDDDDQIRRTCSVLASPLEYVSPNAWRRATLDSLKELTGLAGVQFAIAPFEGVEKFVVEGFDPHALVNYVRDWHHQDEVFAHFAKLGSGPYTRERYSAVDDFGERRRHTAVWNEFYVPNGYIGCAGCILQSPSVFAQLAVHTSRIDDPRVGERAFRQFGAVYSSMESGVRTLRLVHQVRSMLGSVLDQLPTPVALFDQRARAIHWNTALRAQIAAEPRAASSLEAAIAALAGRAVSALRGGNVLPVADTQTLLGYTARVSWVHQVLSLSEPAVMIVFEPTRQVVVTEAVARHRGLSPRQAEAAVYVTKGLRTKEIARAMKLPPTTTAHHIEAAMRKLGVNNRAAVAPALRGEIKKKR